MNLPELQSRVEEEFDKQPFIVKQWEDDAKATDYHLLDMPNEVKSFLRSKIEEAFEAGEDEGMGWSGVRRT